MLEAALRSGPYGLSIDQIRRQAGGLDLGELAPRMPELLRTPGGRIELAPTALLHDLQRATAAWAQPASTMVLIGRRDVRSNNSWMHNLPTLAKGPMRCTALVHPLDAARLGLADGGMARIRRGSRWLDAQVQTSTDMMPGVVSLPHGWGHDVTGSRLSVAAQRPGVNVNELLEEARRDPLSGNAVLSGVAIELTALA